MNEAKAQPDSDSVKLRILEIESELAEMKRRFFVDGVEGDFRRRTTLEAELAALSIQRFKFRTEEAALKAQARELKGNTFLAVLCKKVEDAGMASLIEEAKAESLQAVKDAGLLSAYSAS